MDWKTMLSYISGSVDEELLLRNEYLVATRFQSPHMKAPVFPSCAKTRPF